MSALLATPSPGLYVHVPFCARACPYCDFDFEVGALPLIPDYLDAIRIQVQEEKGAGWGAFDTIYLGGGTPSMLNPEQLNLLLGHLAPLAKVEQMQEVTVEFNPEHAHPELLGVLRALGIGRISMGVQSFDPQGLVSLGRAHQAQKARACLQDAAKAGLAVSCDLMVGWPGQSEAQLDHDLDILIDHQVPHVSIYALTIEPGSRWPGLVKRGLREMPDADRQGDLLARVHERLGAASYLHYEVASYAKNPAQIARHNAKYWSAQDYLGVGPSAHSARYDVRGSVQRWGRRRGLRNWLGSPSEVVDPETLDGEQAASEALWLGLRRLDGLGLDAFLRRFPAVDRDWVLSRTSRLRERGLLRLSADRLCVSDGAWLMHDNIAHELL